jgi:hypothetical protein
MVVEIINENIIKNKSEEDIRRNINYANYFDSIMFRYRNGYMRTGEALTQETLDLIHYVVNGNRYY